MRTGRFWPIATVAVATFLAGCSSGAEPTPRPTLTSPSTTSASPSPTTTAPRPTTSAPTPAACEPFGTTAPSVSSADWSSELRTGPTDALWGVTMRVGAHDCYDRFVFEFAGSADMPGWSVNPDDANTFLADPSGEPISPPLVGSASLDVAFAAWYDGTPIGRDAYEGPRRMVTVDVPAIREARIIGGFEGISHVGIGLDVARPYRVTWLTNPARLVIDVFTG